MCPNYPNVLVTKDDFMDKVAITQGNHFTYLFRHAEFGRVRPYLVIFHDCSPKVVIIFRKFKFTKDSFFDQRQMLRSD